MYLTCRETDLYGKKQICSFALQITLLYYIKMVCKRQERKILDRHLPYSFKKQYTLPPFCIQKSSKKDLRNWNSKKGTLKQNNIKVIFLQSTQFLCNSYFHAEKMTTQNVS